MHVHTCTHTHTHTHAHSSKAQLVSEPRACIHTRTRAAARRSRRVSHVLCVHTHMHAQEDAMTWCPSRAPRLLRARAHTHTHTHTHTHARAQTKRRSQSKTVKYTCVHMHRHTHTYARAHRYTGTLARTLRARDGSGAVCPSHPSQAGTRTLPGPACWGSSPDVHQIKLLHPSPFLKAAVCTLSPKPSPHLLGRPPPPAEGGRWSACLSCRSSTPRPAWRARQARGCERGG